MREGGADLQDTTVHYSLTTKHQYHYKGCEPYIQLLHAVHTWFNTLLPFRM